MKWKCMSCETVKTLAENTNATLQCHNCGSEDVKFDCDIARICVKCGDVANFAKGEKVKTFHQARESGPKHTIFRVTPAIIPEPGYQPPAEETPEPEDDEGNEVLTDTGEQEGELADLEE